MTLSMGLWAFAGTAYCQGLAEYSILTGSASTATANAGSAINKGTNALAGRIGESLSKSTPNVVPENKQKSSGKSPAGRSTARTPSVQNKPMGPIKAMQVVCGPGEVKASGVRSNAESLQASCLSPAKETLPNGGADLHARTESQNIYPSSIDLK
jgi:hypothetical protein